MLPDSDDPILLIVGGEDKAVNKRDLTTTGFNYLLCQFPLKLAQRWQEGLGQWGGSGRWALCEHWEESGTVHVAQLLSSDSLTWKRTCHFLAVPRCIAEIVSSICGRSAARLPDGGKDDNQLRHTRMDTINRAGRIKPGYAECDA